MSYTPGNRKGLFYGWIIVAVCFVVTCITYGAGYSFGVYLIPFRESFGWSSAAVSGAYSLCLFMYTGFATLAGWGVDKYGPKQTTLLGGVILGTGLYLTSQVNAMWQLYATYGLIGIGMSCFYTPLMTTVSRWFVRRRGLALGVFSTGIGVGPLIMAPVITYIISTSGWRFSYIVMAIASAVIIVTSLLLKRSPEQAGELPDGELPDVHMPVSEKQATLESGQFSLKEAVSTKLFWMLAGMFFMIGLGLQMVVAHIVACSVSRGVPPMTAAAVFSAMNGASIVGRLVMGVASDRMGRKKGIALCLFIEGIMILWLIGASSTWMLFLFGVLFGFAWGGHTPQIPALIGETLGLQNMGKILGAASFFWGIGAALGPVLAGYMLDTTGSYTSAFIVGATGMLSAAVINVALKKPRRSKYKSNPPV